jgi:hypothetical protein
MKTPRERAIIVEFSALAVLLLSLGWLAHFKDATDKPSHFFLIIPITASFFVFGGFLSSLFFRWMESKADHTPEAQKMQKAIFAFMAFALSVIWVISVLKVFKLF